MFHHLDLSNRTLKSLIDKGAIKLGGNKALKIYGTLSCRSGKRMKKENRIFFTSGIEAIDAGYRPCGHCMREKYGKWKICHREFVMPTKEASQRT
jgi:methylphosphotriester-DNA--protein-cysteine methyltransferase